MFQKGLANALTRGRCMANAEGTNNFAARQTQSPLRALPQQTSEGPDHEYDFAG